MREYDSPSDQPNENAEPRWWYPPTDQVEQGHPAELDAAVAHMAKVPPDRIPAGEQDRPNEPLDVVYGRVQHFEPVVVNESGVPIGVVEWRCRRCGTPIATTRDDDAAPAKLVCPVCNIQWCAEGTT